MTRLVLALALALAACSVPDVDLANKTCPCETGYTCIANHCVSSGGSGDGPMSASCLGTNPGALIYGDNFDGATLDTGWQTTTMWAQSGGKLTQNDVNDQLAFAYTTRVTQSDYRVVVQMSGTTGGLGLGIAVRVMPGTKTQYDCLWEPGTTGALLLQWTNNGGQPTTLKSQVGIPSGGATETVTMEVGMIGSDLRCCLDNVAGATIEVMNPSPAYPTGQPGLVTDRMIGSFDNFEVYSN